MRKILGLFVFVVLASAAFAQVPLSMNYQAVIRNAQRDLVLSSLVGVRISIVQGTLSGVSVYVERHATQSNENGLVTLVIGQGEVTTGSFAAIDWAQGPYFIRTETDNDGGEEYDIVGTTQLLSVPYAMRSQTSEDAFSGSYSDLVNTPVALSSFVNDMGYITKEELGFALGKSGENVNGSTPGVPAGVWSLKGNSGTDPDKDFIGTTDNTDLNFITNNIVRFSITKAGDINIANNLKVGKDVEVGNDLYVKKNVYLNTVEGQTINNGNFKVANMSSTYLTGTLTVDKGVWLNSTLDVDGATTLNNTLDVDGATTMHDDLTVSGNEAMFMATIINANSSTGDGLLIKLGKNHPAWNDGSYLNLTNPGVEIFDGAISTVSDWINGETFHATDLFNLIPSAYLVGTACKLVNMMSEKLNDALGLPVEIEKKVLLEKTQIFGGVSFGELGSIPALYVPEVAFPAITLIPKLPTLDCSAFPSLTMPNISFVNVTNSLTNDNQFISFKDASNRELGSVRAQGVTDWQTNFFDGVYFVNAMAAVVGIDIPSGIAGLVAEFTNIADAYNKIGVEYASGHGDYAEWLERIDHTELVSTGDVVGVIGGKITKDLTQAEQVMAVSHKPIVLGNSPTPETENLGNKIAFMGQIPVKVVGAVNIGDYIVGNPTTPGYAIAVKPANMTIEHARLTVGRSWEGNSNNGPKMINTVVGVDNGNFLKIIKDNQHKIEQLNNRVDDLDTKVNAIINGQSGYAAGTK